MLKTNSVLLAWLCGSVAVFSQGLTLSPYSRFALGDMQQPALVRSAGMGQGMQGLRSRSQLCPANPASYSGLGLTTYEAGIVSTFTRLRTQADTQNYRNSGFNYVVLGFPISEKKKTGASLGLMPFSTVGYNVSEISDYGFAKTENIFNGNGGLNRLYLGLAKDFKKHLSIGLQGSYVFGSMVNLRSMNFGDSNGYKHNLRDERISTVNGFLGEAGMQFHTDFSDTGKVNPKTGKNEVHNYNFTLGATANLQTSLAARQSIEVLSYHVINSTLLTDTVMYQPSLKGSVVYPMGFSAGLLFQEYDRWSIAADLNYRQWSRFSSFGNTDNLADQYRFCLGFSHVPQMDADKSKHYFKTVEYRGGIRYDRGYLSLNNTRITEAALSLGLGFPFLLQKQLSNKEAARLQVSLELVNRGTRKQSLVQENFMRLMVGITFNDRWFQQPKIY